MRILSGTGSKDMQNEIDTVCQAIEILSTKVFYNYEVRILVNTIEEPYKRII